jgi:NADH-quinone oxidoreductase subunit M
MSEMHLLSWIIFFPLLGVAALLFARERKHILWISFATTVIDMLISLPLWAGFDASTANMQFVEKAAWIPAFNINYSLGVDGISVLLILMTTILMPLSILCSWEAVQKRLKEYMIAILVLETAMLGVFCALDFVLFYFFWEAMLIPMFLIIGIWGGPRRIYATIKFFLFTLAGSVLLLLAILALYFKGGETFDVQTLMAQTYGTQMQFWVFLAFFFAFAVKVPMFPFHTWLPDAHVEAPTAGSVILASVMLKMGTYGFMRFSLPIAPDASLSMAPFMIAISLFAIIYGAYMAIAQTDLKKLVAYSSVSHMGFVTLGIFLFNKMGMEGALLQMINHGITTGALFLCVGMIYERTHSRLITDCSGLGKSMPVYITLLAIFTFSSFGLPGTNGFVGEFLIMVGAFQHSLWVAFLAVPGILLAIAYMLWMFQRMVWGKSTLDKEIVLEDLNVREIATLVFLLGFTFWIGFHPAPYLDIMNVSIDHLIQQVAGLDAGHAAVAVGGR